VEIFGTPGKDVGVQNFEPLALGPFLSVFVLTAISFTHFISYQLKSQVF